MLSRMSSSASNNPIGDTGHATNSHYWNLLGKNRKLTRKWEPKTKPELDANWPVLISIHFEMFVPVARTPTKPFHHAPFATGCTWPQECQCHQAGFGQGASRVCTSSQGIGKAPRAPRGPKSLQPACSSISVQCPELTDAGWTQASPRLPKGWSRPGQRAGPGRAKG